MIRKKSAGQRRPLAVHWGVLKHVREDVGANRWVPITAMVLDALILGAFLWMKATSDMLVIWVAVAGMVIIFAGERWFLEWREEQDEEAMDGTA